MNLHVFLMATFVGMALIALWVHVRFPKLAPLKGKGVIVHLVLATALAHAVAMSIQAAAPSTLLVLVGLFGAGYPALVYMFLSVLWLFAALQGMMSSAFR